MATTGVVVEDVVRRIRAIDREFMDGVTAKDAVRVTAIYSENARILMPGRPIISGKAEILAFWKAAFVGHRFSADERHLVVAQAKEKGNTPVLLVCGASPESGIPAANRVYALEGNAGLLSALSRLSAGEAARPQAAA